MNRTICFDAFAIDARAAELSRDGKRIDLAPAAVHTLLILVERSGELVSREELYSMLWPDGGVDTKRLLNTYIKQIRAALGERHGDDRFIRTYPRRGYRFLQPVVTRSARVSPVMRRRVPTLTAIIVGMVVVGAAWFALQYRQTINSSQDSLPELAEARIEYLTGLELLENPLPGIRASAVPHFQTTAKLEPNYAPAFSGLAESLVWAGRTNEARTAAAASLALDSSNARAHLAMGSTMLTGSWQWETAEQHLRTSRYLQPEEPSSGVALAFLLVSAGRDLEARHLLDEIVQLEPVSPVVTGDLGMLYGWLGEHQTALELCQRTTRIEPRATWGHRCALDAARALGRGDIVAIESAAIVHDLDTDTTTVFTPFADIETRVKQLYRFELARNQRFVSHFRAALIWSDLGAVTKALDELEKAAVIREMGFVSILAAPSFRSLHSEPRFIRLVDQLFANVTI